MTKYYLKDHVTDEMLRGVGFGIITNSWGYKWAVRNWFKNTGVSITLHNFDDSDYLKIVSFARNPRKPIKDIIKLDYVEVRND